ncbi:hypothetical protein ACSU6B_25485 [Neobacillus sp. C211]|uniref:hypothetical protein n=1 Tax=unclassified Neobacillus TaxID=2675272 RepID=UPI00397C2D09
MKRQRRNCLKPWECLNFFKGMLGADVSLTDWWFWNQIPVLVGNLASGFIFTGLAMYLIYKKDITKEKVSTFSSNLKRVSS